MIRQESGLLQAVYDRSGHNKRGGLPENCEIKLVGTMINVSTKDIFKMYMYIVLKMAEKKTEENTAEQIA